MMDNNLKQYIVAKGKKLVVSLASTGLVLTTTIAGSPVLAKQDNAMVTSLPTNHATPNGVALLGNGPASITIKCGRNDLRGKKFAVYKLFDEENSVDGESVNYKWNSQYKSALQSVVGKRLNKEASKVTEYEVIDYMQSLDDLPDKTPEGAHPGSGNQDVRPQPDNKEQHLEGRYSDFRYFVEDLRDELRKQNLDPMLVEVTDLDEHKNITFAGLDYGYYLTDEIYTEDEEHAAASLIMTNTANPNAEVVIKSDYPEVKKKIFEDDELDKFDNTHAGPTSEELGTWSDAWKNVVSTDKINANKVGWQDINDVEIGQKANYEFTSYVPDMNGYDSYYFAFHDQMNKCLTFDADSVVIEIDGMNGSEHKNYVLQPEDYTVYDYLNDNDEDDMEMASNTDADTFLIEIDDLKEIVDREFRNGFDDYNHNQYGQRIRVRYNATLNDDARFETGRDGFENTVYLEFSNDPDVDGYGRTGFTSEDTVVTFTYALNIKKLNQDDKVLANAEFRLYTDKECTNEVFTKEMPEGNVVINRDSLGGSDHIGGAMPEEATVIRTDENGDAVIYGLDQGVYYLKEVKAPAGYRQLLDPIQFEILPTFTTERDSYIKGQGATDSCLQQLNANSHVTSFYEGIYHPEDTQLDTNVQNGSANIVVVNQKGKVLPKTGSNETLILVTCGVIVSVIGYVLSKKKKQQAE